MTPDEIDRVLARLTALWPQAYTDPQLSDMIQRLARFTCDDCMFAIDRWRDREPYKPQPANLITIIAARREGQNRKPVTFADILRVQHPELARENNAFVLWTYYRGMWRHGRMLVLAQYRDRESKHKAEIDAAIAANTRRFAGELSRQLQAHGYDTQPSDALAAWLDAEDVREAVDTLRATEIARSA